MTMMAAFFITNKYTKCFRHTRPALLPAEFRPLLPAEFRPLLPAEFRPLLPAELPPLPLRLRL